MKDEMVAVINVSTVIDDRDLEASIPDFQAAVNEDFGPFWGRTGKLVLVPKDQKPPPGSWWIVVLDTTDEQDLLDCYDLSNEGKPLSKVFAKTALQYKHNWGISFSHQLFEMLADPWIAWLATDDSNMSHIYGVDVCDPVVADELAYKKGNTMISDFVLPIWFGQFWDEGQSKFDFMGHVNGRLRLAKGGYISTFRKSGGWFQVFVPSDKEARINSRAPKGSRRERRRIPKEQWMLSQISFSY